MKEVEIELNDFEVRDYQAPIWIAYKKGYKRILAILPRRAGKDISTWNLLIRAALQKSGIYWFVYPSYSQGKKVLWNGMNSEGQRWLSYLPAECIKSMNSTDMSIRLHNESIIQIVGADNPDSLRGVNPCFVVLSEYRDMDPGILTIIRPVLEVNNGTLIVISTPEGHNALWQMWQIAQANPTAWFSYLLTIRETKHITEQQVEDMITRGEMTYDMAQQEFYCSFDRGIEGTIWGKYLKRARIENRITTVLHEPAMLTHMAMDIGVNDCTTILWFQVPTGGNMIRIIDCYSSNNRGLDHYIDIIKSKPYRMGNHYAPHDLKVREFSTGMTRYSLAKSLGIDFKILPQQLVEDSITNVYLSWPKIYIDETKCKDFLEACDNYYREYDEKGKRYRDHPVKNWAIHYNDAFRYLIQAVPLVSGPTYSAKELDESFMKARYGDNVHLPPIFRNHH